MESRKRFRPDSSNGGFKKSKQDTDSSGLGSKTKPCTKYFSTAGCPFGESCHFLHNFPGGYNAVAQLTNIGPSIPSLPRNIPLAAPTPIQNGSTTTKSKMCNKYNTAEGCKFGDKCHFAHGEWELGKPVASSHEDLRSLAPAIPARLGGYGGYGGGRVEPPPPALAAAASFGASATAKISVDASLAGAIIGKGGVNSKLICRQTGAKLSIRDHESDTNLRNIELEGTFEQIKEASTMVRELIVSIGTGGGGGGGGGGVVGKPHGGGAPAGGAPQYGVGSNNFKTKLCENFAKGACTFGDRCHFAHGDGEMRKSGV